MACDEAGIPKLVRISRLTAFGIPGFLRERVIPGAAPAKFLWLVFVPINAQPQAQRHPGPDQSRRRQGERFREQENPLCGGLRRG